MYEAGKQNRQRHELIPELVIILLSTVINGNWGNYIRWILLIVLIAWRVIKRGGKIKIISMPGVFFYALFMVICVINGAVLLMKNNTTLWFFTRDIILTSTYGLEWLLICNIVIIYKSNKRKMWQSVVTASSMLTVFALLRSLPKLVEGISSFSDFVNGMPTAQWTLAIGIILFMFHPPEVNRYYFSRRIDKLLLILEIVMALLSFSRTFFVIFGSVLIVLALNKINIINFLKYVIMFFVGIIVIYNLLPEVSLVFVSKVFNSFQEISASGNWNITAAVLNWRGYEVYCAKKTFSQYNSWQMIFGKGFGATIVADYSQLVTGEGQLPFLHNGYYTALIKGGLVGVGAYGLMFVVQIVRVISNKRMHKFDRKMCVGMIIGLILTSIVVQGVYFGSMYIIPWAIIAWNIMAESNLTEE